jgi:hypothetical protein
MLRRIAVTLALATVVGLTAGCQPEPAPSPTAPVFASEDEAFAAAEETYRAYVDALNARRIDASADPDPQTFLTGEALETDIDTQVQLHQSGLTIAGVTEVTAVDPVGADPTSGTVQMDICLDSSMTRVLNDSGDDVTPIDRESVSLLTVAFLSTDAGILIESSETKVLGEC